MPSRDEQNINSVSKDPHYYDLVTLVAPFTMIRPFNSGALVVVLVVSMGIIIEN
jgi:hypothetical protein